MDQLMQIGIRGGALEEIGGGKMGGELRRQLGNEIGGDLQKDILLLFQRAKIVDLIGKYHDDIPAHDLVYGAVNGSAGVSLKDHGKLDLMVKVGVKAQGVGGVPDTVSAVNILIFLLIHGLHGALLLPFSAVELILPQFLSFFKR